MNTPRTAVLFTVMVAAFVAMAVEADDEPQGRSTPVVGLERPGPTGTL